MSNMKAVSVNRAMGDRIQAAAEERGVSMGALVECACADLPTDPVEVAALADRVWASMPSGARTIRGG